MSRRVYIPILFGALFLLLALGIFKLPQGSDEDTNTFVVIRSDSTDCAITPEVSKQLAAPITVDGINGSVNVYALVFKACVDPKLTVEPTVLEGVFQDSIVNLDQMIREDLATQVKDRVFISTLTIKIAGATAAQVLLEKNPDYKGRITIHVGTLPHTGERLVIIKKGGSH